jgi:hypothetical protein
MCSWERRGEERRKRRNHVVGGDTATRAFQSRFTFTKYPPNPFLHAILVASPFQV